MLQHFKRIVCIGISKGYFIFLISLFSVYQPATTIAQNQIRILEGERLETSTINGQKVQKILGNVHLLSENLEIFCDSAYSFENQNELRAFGNIEINTEDERIWSDSLIYFTDVDFSQLRGHVIIEADSTTLYSDAVDYRFSTKVGHFLKKVRLEDQQGVLTANTGFYYREPDSAVFRGKVQLADSLQYAEGDSLFINLTSESYELYSDIYVDDRENNIMLKGEYLRADSTGRRLLKRNAWLKKFKSDSVKSDTVKNDTTHIRASIIESIRNITITDTTTLINAYQNVRIWSEEFSAIADTARFEDESDSFELFGNPIAWHDHIQLTGPYIQVTLTEQDEIDKLVSYPRPFIVQQDTTLNRLNQITGDTLITHFKNGSISRMQVINNSHLLRYTKDKNDNPDGALELRSKRNLLYFEDGELIDFVAKENIDGSYYPESPVVADRKLDGFNWSPEIRPEEPDQRMKRRWPAIPNSPPFELPERYLNRQPAGK